MDTDHLGNQPVPDVDNVTILLDGRPYRAVGEEMTGAQILSLAGIEPDGVELYAQGHHGLRIGAEESVPVQDGSRFVTRQPEDHVGGSGAHPVGRGTTSHRDAR